MVFTIDELGVVWVVNPYAAITAMLRNNGVTFFINGNSSWIVQSSTAIATT